MTLLGFEKTLVTFCSVTISTGLEQSFIHLYTKVLSSEGQRVEEIDLKILTFQIETLT